VERLMIMSPGPVIGPDQVSAVLPAHEAAAGGTLTETMRDFERRVIEDALQRSGGSMSDAAGRLGLERSHLYKKMRKLGLRPGP